MASRVRPRAGRRQSNTCGRLPRCHLQDVEYVDYARLFRHRPRDTALQTFIQYLFVSLPIDVRRAVDAVHYA